MMQLQAVNKSYRQEQVLRDVDLSIEQGQFTAFIGPNGAGKSTLLAIMSRLLVKDKGAVMIKGRELEDWSSQALAKELTMLKQKITIQAKFSVEELIAFGRFPYSKGRLKAEDQVAIDQAIHYMELKDLRSRPIDTLSGGQLQRVYIAMVLAQDTDIILLDEPLNNLDIKQELGMMTILRRLVDELGKTVVIVIHDINMASQFVDQMVAFKNGTVFCRGTPNQVMTESILTQLYDIPLSIVEVNGKKLCLYS